MRFYYAADWNMKYLHVPNILLSFGVVHNRKTGYNRKTEISSSCRSLFLDCGAFTFRSGPYPWVEYYNWIIDHVSSYPDVLDLVATVDVIGDYRKTVANGIRCIDMDTSLPWLPVLQGATVKEYVECLRMYEAADIDVSYCAVGGLKPKNQYLKRAILDRLSQEMVHLHGFGLVLKDLRDATIYNAVRSADSASWKNRPQTNKEKFINLEKFMVQLEEIKTIHTLQTTLEEKRKIFQKATSGATMTAEAKSTRTTKL